MPNFTHFLLQLVQCRSFPTQFLQRMREAHVYSWYSSFILKHALFPKSDMDFLCSLSTNIAKRIWIIQRFFFVRKPHYHLQIGNTAFNKHLLIRAVGLVGWVLWHINLCRVFNAKSIFIQIISSILNNSV